MVETNIGYEQSRLPAGSSPRERRAQALLAGGHSVLKELGVGTNDPATAVHIVKETVGAGFLTERIQTSVNSGSFSGRKARGTLDDRAVVVADDSLLTVSGFAYVGDNNTYQEACRIDYDVDGSVSDALKGAPGRIIFRTSSGSGLLKRMRITSAGKVGIGLDDPSTKLTVEGAITLKEQATADADVAAYGQLWVKTAIPNQLYFTNDAGDDIQITNLTTLAPTGIQSFQLEDGDGTEVTILDAKEIKFVEGTGIDINWTDTSHGTDGDPFDLTFSVNLEGTELISTGEGGGSKFLREDGDGTCSWQTISGGDTTYSISCVNGDNSDEEKIRLTAGGSGSGTDDIVLEAGTGLSIARSSDKITFTNTVSDTNTTYSPGDGLDISGTTFSTDLKSNGGLVIESTELAVDLGASSITGTLAVGDGGTGLTSISTLLNSNVTPSSLGLVIGTNVQAHDADLLAIAGLSSGDSNFIVGSGSEWVAESGSTARTSLGVDAAGVDNSTNVTLAGSLNYITLSGQEITRNAVDLAADVSGNLPDGNIASASTWNAKQAALTFGIANTNAVKVDDADAADNDYAKFTASGVEGRSYSEVKTDLSLGTAADRAAEDTLTDGSNLPDGAAIKTYGDANWSGGISHDGNTANGVLTYKDADEATVEANMTFNGNSLAITTGSASAIPCTITGASGQAVDFLVVEANGGGDYVSVNSIGSIVMGLAGSKSITTKEQSGTNIAGHDIFIKAGKSTGSGLGGDVRFYTSPAGSSGVSVNAWAEALKIRQDKVVDFKISAASKSGAGTATSDFMSEVEITPSRWLEIKIGGVQYFLPAFAASQFS